LNAQPASARWIARPAVRRTLAIALTLGAFAYLFSIVDVDELWQAMRRVSLSAWCAALLLCAASVSCGALRWWLLFRAFDAPRPPALSALFRHYMTGMFYNTYLPGGVSGDVVRGMLTQRAFDTGSAGGFATVFFERVLGVCALLCLVATAMLLHPLPGTAGLRRPMLLAVAVGMCAAVGLLSFGRMARLVPAALARQLARLPVPRALTPLVLALLLSFGSQLAPALCGHMLLCAIHGPVALLDSLSIVPLSTAAAFLPFSVSGAGVRETVFVELYARVGVPAQAALAASLCLWAAQATLAGLGGLYVVLGDTARAADPTATGQPRG
jgi:uncharacterized membrane protein YbhN (UPF0104 family)